MYKLNTKPIKLNEFIGNYHVVRAMEIAVIGEHWVILIGGPNTGKSLIRDIFRGLVIGDYVTEETQPCSCGYYLNDTKECVCEVSEVFNISRKYPQYDIYVYMEEFLDFDKIIFQKNIGENEKELKERIKKARKFLETNRDSMEIDPLAIGLLKIAYNQLYLDIAAMYKIIGVSKSIAASYFSKIVEPPHMAEAIQYRVRHK